MSFSNKSVLLLYKFLLGTGNSIVSYIYHVRLCLVFNALICYLILSPNKVGKGLLGVPLLVSYFLYCMGFIRHTHTQRGDYPSFPFLLPLCYFLQGTVYICHSCSFSSHFELYFCTLVCFWQLAQAVS